MTPALMPKQVFLSNANAAKANAAKRKLSSEYALKLRCGINEAVPCLRGTDLASDKREVIVQRYLAFINANHGRPPCQYSVDTERLPYQQYQRAKRKLPNEQCRELQRKIEKGSVGRTRQADNAIQKMRNHS